MGKLLFAAIWHAGVLCAAAGAHAADQDGADQVLKQNAYQPMAIFDRFAGRTLRGEGTAPDGAPVVDIARWDFILGGRAFQSTHRLEGGDYGGRTIFFYDEGAEKYVFHYFTTAGFHTTGETAPSENGFRTVEYVHGHPDYAEVHSEVVIKKDENGEDVFRVLTSYVDKDGEASQMKESFVYREIDGPGPSFDE